MDRLPGNTWAWWIARMLDITAVHRDG